MAEEMNHFIHSF